jgi:pyridoxal phosphate enzyme (YggS family)
MNIAKNMIHIQEWIGIFENKSKRSLNSVHLLAVSKKKSVTDIEKAITAGQTAFGENYVQEAIEKIQALKKYPHLEWHYIGKIQKNKLKDLAKYFDWVQTLDSKEAAEKLNAACEKLNKKIQVCIQVNISDELKKNGVDIGEIQPLAEYIIEACPFLCLRGLMTIGLATQDEMLLKKMFKALKENYDTLKIQYANVDTLSMGMSSDLGIAIECGSTMVRVGTGIFGER